MHDSGFDRSEEPSLRTVPQPCERCGSNLLTTRLRHRRQRRARGHGQPVIVITAKGGIDTVVEGEYYRHDLIGLAVVTREGEHIGTLSDALTTGANDVYVIKREGKPDALIPAIPDVVLTVDIPTRTMTIEAMPGLLD